MWDSPGHVRAMRRCVALILATSSVGEAQKGSPLLLPQPLRPSQKDSGHEQGGCRNL